MATLSELLAPGRCLVCRRRGPMPWCADCAPPPRRGATCPRCAATLGGSAWAGARALDEAARGCPLRGSAVDAVVAAHDYAGPVAVAVRVAKLEACVGAYEPMGRDLARAVQAAEVADVDAVTSVPVPRRRRRRRGFDHAARLARPVAAVFGRSPAMLLAVVGRAPDRGAGEVGIAEMVPTTASDGHVLLVDDVMTTGATVRAAARCLVDAGADRVTVAVIGRAGRHGP